MTGNMKRWEKPTHLWALAVVKVSEQETFCGRFVFPGGQFSHASNTPQLCLDDKITVLDQLLDKYQPTHTQSTGDVTQLSGRFRQNRHVDKTPVMLPNYPHGLDGKITVRSQLLDKYQTPSSGRIPPTHQHIHRERKHDKRDDDGKPQQAPHNPIHLNRHPLPDKEQRTCSMMRTGGQLASSASGIDSALLT